MKLTIVFLLVTLMIGCYSATAAEVCPLLNDIMNKYLFAPYDEYMKAIAPFVSTDDMTEAASRLKQCTLEVPQHYLLAKGELLKNILAKCSEAPQIHLP